jgi:para-nitrobenzyl esterase
MAAPVVDHEQIYPDLDPFFRGNRQMREKQADSTMSQDRCASTIDRRSLLGGMAALGAGIAGSMVAPQKLLAVSETASHTTKDTLAAPCGRSKVVASDAATVVETSAGKIRGYERNGIYIFKGAPYGASTSGSRRFMPPEKPEPWSGIRNALEYGRICPQHETGWWTATGNFSMDGKNLASDDEYKFLLHRGSAICIPGEDCLRVNLWTPEINGFGKRPVMVFIHGGGFADGCSQDLLSYDGENLARNHDVVVVNHNHRLNVYGYLNLAGFGGDEFASSANTGMLDIVAVLEWVRTHVSQFGGDPNNVTIFGQSGGGCKVAALMAMPAAKGLFHRAIIESGPTVKAVSPEFSQRVARALLDELGLSESQVRELQNLPVERLSGAAMKAMSKVNANPPSLRYGTGWEIRLGWGPTVDGRTLPTHPFDPGAPAVSADVPLITGTSLTESVNGIDHPHPNDMTVEEMTQRVREDYGSQSDAIIAAYREDYPKASPFELYGTISTASWRIPEFQQASRKAALGAAPAYAYIYSWRTPILDNRPGSFHAAELAFVFDNAELLDHYSAGDPAAYVLDKQMSTAWVSFARTGNPNHSGMPHWPAYTADTRATMIFNAPCEVRNNPEGKGLGIIAQQGGGNS